LLPHGVKKKKAKKKTSTTIRKYTYHRIFLATLNSKIKKKMNLVAPKNEILLLTVGKTLL
jgi:protoheme ferro-lyase